MRNAVILASGKKRTAGDSMRKPSLPCQLNAPQRDRFEEKPNEMELS